MCDACANYFLTADGWIRADDSPPGAVAKTTFHEPMKMYQSGYWEGPTAIVDDQELVKRLLR